MSLHARYPAISDLKSRARQRIPKFVWEYLDSATGNEATLRRNRAALDRVLFTPSILHGELPVDLSTNLCGTDYPMPFGISPVGMSGLIWPDAERKLARAATKAGLPYSISTVATRTPEEVAPRLNGNGWFQMYPPRDEGIRTDMLKRAKDAGFSTLILTVDVPVPSRRERQVRSGLTTPPKLTPRLLAQIAMRPTWAMMTASMGAMPRMKLIDDYAGKVTGLSSTQHAGYLLRTSPDWDYVTWLRDAWDGTFFVKGVMNAEDAPRLEKAGVDAIWLSNHAGRQFDASPAPIEALPAIREATSLPLILDSGVEGGLDILRAIALGADFVMLGRAWHYALAALDTAGPAHLIEILEKDMAANMGQLGVTKPLELRGKAWFDGPGPHSRAISTG
ncbi:alpha-hydroxy acid oxidase [Marivita sp. XM-24bin2]|jgi:L-lactate dehydrogenase (cytochrome)|uniref:alpha-hydroxy acid oxidase n=1 Tax=unclassified Marivita TaxID=2632480 RepID=UPI000D792F16|nr:alpha-hydroxy acid oxidase [Marivita sp. XM-24bin2]MCR9111439.1 alpha-hydroxy-acid oxidizing protein [Paracoccaceae bacterium]PWL36621.1 MAG: alpha-hydroxy-acid oxidizing enzyme [Marivita sp. XM-24bin2]